MDNKTWLWRKKSSEKTIVPADQKIHNSSRGNEEEILLTEKAKLEKDVKVLNDKLSSALSECEDKDELEKKHSKMAQEAILGWEKAEADVVSLKEELDEALQQRVASEERSAHLDVALGEYMQQLRFVQEEQEKRIHDAVIKTSREFEKSQMVLEEKLAETTKRLAKIGVENSHLSNSLLVKEKLIEEVKKQLTQMETDFGALMTRLQSTEKHNASLKYEVQVLEKELEIRNAERGFNRQTADASHKQHLESVKKIAKLESECQRLRRLVRKRLPGPVALAKMTSEAEMLERDSVEMRRANLNTTAFKVDSAVDGSPENPTKRISIMAQQLSSMEEANKNLMETLHKKANELQFSRKMYAHTASKLSQVKLQLEEVSKGQNIVEPTNIAPVSHDLCPASISNIGSNDKVRCAESWASALTTELEHSRNGKQKGLPSPKTVGISEINLMDDFVEMERLALVTVDKPLGSCQFSSHEANAISSPLEMEQNQSSSELMGREIIPLPNSESGFSMSKQEIRSKDAFTSKVPDWLQDILKMGLEQNLVTHRNPDELLEDIRAALALINPPNHIDVVDASNATLISGYILEEPSNKSLAMASSDGGVSLTEKTNTQLQLNLSKSIGKIIELIKGIGLPSLDYNNPETLARKDENMVTYKNSEIPAGDMVRVFQWKTSELSAVLQQFVHTCDDLLNGKANIDKFAQELTAALDWIMKYCFSPQDVSNMKEAIIKNFDWDKSRSESEAEVGMISHFSEAGRVPREQLSYFLMAATSSGNCLQMEELQSTLMEENRKSRGELMNLKSAKKDLGGRLQLATEKREPLMNQHLKSEKTITCLQKEFETLKESKGKTEIQIKIQKLMKEDPDRQLTVAGVELNEAQETFSSLEVEADDKTNCCEELEATCLEQQLHFGGITKKESPNNDLDLEEKHFRADWEITAASEKLAECQETILNLGKQLKALAAPKEAILFDKVIATPNDTVTATTFTTPTPHKDKIMYQQSSLLDQMLAEDDAKAPKTKQINGNCTGKVNEIIVLNGIKNKNENASASSLAIVPRKKRGGGSLWKKLLWRKKMANSKKPPLLLAP
ncbi:filament-like plant protein 7 [Carya illinoinensis]|uniref:Filament-like plant protein 7 n=1 Tax=Carya illinoinensis TaxID=32201 RepID=A0A8T1R9B6_CARIL|nr:filament-like plant protein 7 [Carya illinoinensis]XP_042961767.1 filament-like plant protein 7 [Carya illinoinensis]KAG6663159.1 hypothetical protein CIPAW_02G007300 [Carya illinoinensis]KAG6663160.1 hypothetical protein CIPAW_02G007300 [Carya illinoinensis]